MKTTISKLLPAVLLATLCALVAAPAHAEKVVTHDQVGDAEFYDIASVTVFHRERRVRVKIHAEDRTPYGYHVFVDRPGGQPWERVLMWTAYKPHWVTVRDRHQFKNLEGVHCSIRSAKETLRDVTFSIPARCFGKHDRLRFKTKAWDDEAGYTDRTRWSEWANRA